MENYLKQIEAAANKAANDVNVLITQLLPILIKRIEECESNINAQINTIEAQDKRMVSINDSIFSLIKRIQVIENHEFNDTPEVEKPKSTKRQQTDYPTYVKTKSLSDSGMTEKEIAAEMGIPYTTVRAYLRWTDEQAARKKQQWDAKKSNIKYIEPEAVVIVPKEPVVYSVTDEQREAYIDTHVPTPKVYDEEPLDIPFSYMDEEELVVRHKEEVSLNGFYEWTAEDRALADVQAHYPDSNTDLIIVAVRDGNAYTMPYMIKELNWGADSEITNWRYATENEQTQYIQRYIGNL